ncbi:hypothetical protein TSUD_248620 [Trifolium subterraneum]|uniref:F-box associated beta-propeller type 1 domain-containing protein n=1 Tax=Trifolium subterraneum TaxID=3900 RepID=A0A2Z6LK83_TRISU|nr:hypothetical protein TSUD_248620 [Trifolium subterraneum]
MDEETEEAVATNKAVVRSKRKKSRMNRFVFGTRSAIKKKMTEAVASNKAIRSKRKKKKDEIEAVAVMTTSNKKARNYLNHDSTLFQDSYFMTIYTNKFISNNNNNNHYDDTYLVRHGGARGEDGGGVQFYLLPGHRFENRIKIDLPPPLQGNDSWFYILGGVSINGILCFNQRCARRLVLWNPTTAEFKIIPHTPCHWLPPNRQPLYDLNGFGYDHATNDYKVIQFVDSCRGGGNPDEDEDQDQEFVPGDRSSYETFWGIYSLKTNSWRKLDLNIPNRYYYTQNRFIGVYTNGVCHWWARTDDSPNIEDAEEYLLSFNFSNELMFTTPRPSYLDVRHCLSSKLVDRCLFLLNESIALISTNLDMATIQISILGELGVRESWTKFLTVMCLPSIEYPIGVGNLSNIVFFAKNDDKLAWINLNTKMTEELDFKVEKFVYVGKYKKSFLPICGRNE